MPGKSRRRKGKHSVQSKRKGRAGSPNLSPQPPAATQIQHSTPSPMVAAPSTKAVAPAAKPTGAQYLYITTELWTIGILASIMLVGLVVLALVLS